MRPNQYPKASSVNREAAKARGDKTYESATPCKSCGGNVKYVVNHSCFSCTVKNSIHKLANTTLMAPYRTRAIRNATTYRYRARKRKAVSADADPVKIMKFYEESERLTRETGIQHNVDHIIPLSRGGLHHQDNLQVLTESENKSKGNRIL